ncbi:hypothetical protein JIY74_32720 [Vibrio harveyi]|nr:hypothetical protein [Vibrio harveyi]
MKNIKFYEPKNSVYEAKVYELYNKTKNKK